MEGGALEVNGEGTLMATESSVLNPNRNHGRTKAEIEDHLRDLLGVRKIIWLQGARGIDVTDYHVDSLARFGHSNTVILSRPNAEVQYTNPRYMAYEQAKSVLSTSINAAGQPLKVVDIEEAETVPRALGEDDGLALGEPVTTYVNFYLVNGAVIVPQFGDERTDRKAVEMMKMLFPKRTVETVLLNWMPWAGGGVHGATQQWPLLSER